MIEIKDLSIAYNRKKEIIKNLNFILKRGECLTILGKNGSGKSTLGYALIKIIPTLIKANISGTCLIESCEYNLETAKKIIAYSFQDTDSQLVSLCIGGKINSHNFQKKYIPQSENDIIYSNPAYLSDGQKQKLILSTIMSSSCEYFILDEPTMHLDHIEKRNFVEDVKNYLQERKRTFIIITHDIEIPFQLNCKCLYINKEGHKFFSNFKDFEYFYKREYLSLFKSYNFKKKDTKAIEKSKTIVALSEVQFRYKNNKYFSIRDLKFDIYDGEILGIAGSNGSGKSTLIKLLAGVLKPTKGKIIYTEHNKNNLKRNDSPRTAILFQNPNRQIFCSSIKEELEFGLKNYRTKKENIRKRIDWATNFMNLDSLDEDPFSLSYGQKKILCLASTVILRSRFLLLDEPDLSLDRFYSDKLFRVIRKLNKEKVTIVIASHNKKILDKICSRIIFLENGRINHIY